MKSTDAFETTAINGARTVWPRIYLILAHTTPGWWATLPIDHPSFALDSIEDVERLAGNLHLWTSRVIARHGLMSPLAIRIETLCRYVHELLFDTADAPRLAAQIAGWP